MRTRCYTRQAQLDAALAALAIAEAQRDAALADLNNLFTNNSCFPLAGTIQEVFDCITALITDLATAQGDLTDALVTRVRSTSRRARTTWASSSKPG